MAKKRAKKTYRYECTLTGQKFVTTAQSPNPDDLVSVKAYYELNPTEDDRPEHIKLQVENQQVEDPFAESNSDESEESEDEDKESTEA